MRRGRIRCAGALAASGMSLLALVAACVGDHSVGSVSVDGGAGADAAEQDGGHVADGSSPMPAADAGPPRSVGCNGTSCAGEWCCVGVDSGVGACSASCGPDTSELGCTTGSDCTDPAAPLCCIRSAGGGREVSSCANACDDYPNDNDRVLCGDASDCSKPGHFSSRSKCEPGGFGAITWIKHCND